MFEKLSQAIILSQCIYVVCNVLVAQNKAPYLHKQFKEVNYK